MKKKSIIIFVVLVCLLFLVFYLFPILVTGISSSLRMKTFLLLIQVPFTYWLGCLGANAAQINSIYLKRAAAFFFVYGVTAIIAFLAFLNSILKFSTLYRYSYLLFLIFMISIFLWLTFCMVMMVMANRRKSNCRENLRGQGKI